MRKHYNIFAIFILSMNSIFSQSSKVDEDYILYNEFDYFNFEYTYLNSRFEIIISNEDFQELVEKNNIYNDRIEKYSDSIFVVLYADFDNNTQRRIGHQRITHSWLRTSYYLWCSEVDAFNLSLNYDFQYPYQFFDFIWNKDDQWDKRMKKYMRDFRKEVMESTNRLDIKEMNNKEFLRFALVNNPQRQADFSKFKSNEGKGCGKPNCCQTSKRSSGEAVDCDSLKNISN